MHLLSRTNPSRSARGCIATQNATVLTGSRSLGSVQTDRRVSGVEARIRLVTPYRKVAPGPAAPSLRIERGLPSTTALDVSADNTEVPPDPGGVVVALQRLVH